MTMMRTVVNNGGNADNDDHHDNDDNSDHDDNAGNAGNDNNDDNDDNDHNADTDGSDANDDDDCDNVDNDCDGDVDEGVTTTWYADNDFDGFGDANSPTEACSEPTGLVLIDGDCDDTTASVFPGAQDGCNAVDDDCDGTVDEDVKLGWSLVSIDTTTGYVYEIDPSKNSFCIFSNIY